MMVTETVEKEMMKLPHSVKVRLGDSDTVTLIFGMILLILYLLIN